MAADDARANTGVLRRPSLPILPARTIAGGHGLRRISVEAAQFGTTPTANWTSASNRLSDVAEWESRRTDASVPPPGGGQDGTATKRSDTMSEKKRSAQHLMGTAHGVYIPVLENMWGVLIFLRFFYIVGNAGVYETLGIVALSFLAALLTSFSLSAVATNGPIEHGGAYFIISRAVGPRVGAAVGLVYFLGVSLLAVLESLGAVEMLLFTAPAIEFTSANRVWGAGFIVVLSLMVYMGVRWISRFGLLFAIIVALTMLSYYVGLAIAPDAQAPCEVTGLNLDTLRSNLYPRYNRGQNFATMLTLFFPCFTGILSGANRSTSLADPAKAIPRGTIAAIVTSLVVYTSFFLMWAAVAPRDYLVSGSGTRESRWPGNGQWPPGDVRADVCVDQYTHYSGVPPAAGRRRELKASAGSADALLVITDIAWPVPIATQIGVIIASLAQAMQCLVVSPRMLQAIAADGTIPALKSLQVMSGPHKDEPKRALICTMVLCLLGVQIGKLDPVAPMLSCCFLVCYAALNLSTAIHSYTHSPDWRPTFGISHWSVGVVGFLLCSAISFVINWMYTLILIVAVLLIAMYVGWCDVAVSWGTGVGGLQLKLALRWATQQKHLPRAIVRYTNGGGGEAARQTEVVFEDEMTEGDVPERKRAHVSHWRPQLIILRRPDETRTALRKQRLLEVAHQLKHGGGLTCLTSVVEGNAADPATRAMLAQMRRDLERELFLVRAPVRTSEGGGLLTTEDAAAAAAATVVIGEDSDENYTVAQRPGRCRTSCSPCLASGCITPIIGRGPHRWCMHKADQPHLVKLAGTTKAILVPPGEWRVGCTAALQAIGLGALEPNMLLCGLSIGCNQTAESDDIITTMRAAVSHDGEEPDVASKRHLASLLRIAASVGKAACVVHSTSAWPTSAVELDDEFAAAVHGGGDEGTTSNGGDDEVCGLARPSTPVIDVYWCIHDGGLLVLLAHLLRRHSVWKKCAVRVFCVIDERSTTDQREAARTAIANVLFESRIPVDVVALLPLSHSDVEAFIDDCGSTATEPGSEADDVGDGESSIDDGSSCDSRLAHGVRAASFEVAHRAKVTMPPTLAPAPDEEDPTPPQTTRHVPQASTEDHTAGDDVNTRMHRMLAALSFTRRRGLQAPPHLADGLLSGPSSSHATTTRTKSDDSEAHQPIQVQARTLHAAIYRRSKSSNLVLINLPGPGTMGQEGGDADIAYHRFMESLVGLDEGEGGGPPLRRCLLVHGTGHESFTDV